MKIAVIGSGNLATHLSLALQYSGNNIVQVYSRNIDNARWLADKLACKATDKSKSCEAINNINKVSRDADLYIIAVKDDAIREVAEQLCHERPDAIFLHTAGSVTIDIFEGLAKRYGVLWPIQSLSKYADVDFRKVPCCIEASDNETLETIKKLTESITETIRIVPSEKRRKMHLAAVFANNLTNHCYRLAEKITEEEELDFSLLLPMIEETARKVSRMSPRDAQTGPMVRYDQAVMSRQLDLITDERTKAIYKLMAESIHTDSIKA